MNRFFTFIVITGLLFCTSYSYSSWEKLTLDLNAQSLNFVDFDSSNSIVAVGDGGIVKISRDWGSTWDYILMDVRQNLLSAKFLNDKTLLCGGIDGLLFRSTDGGKKWNNIPSGITSEIIRINFFTPLIGLAITKDGKILKTEDAGSTWNKVVFTKSAIFNDLAIANETTAYIAGNSGLVIKTTDAGNTWNETNTGTITNLTRIAALSNGKIFIGGEHLAFLFSNDAGSSFQSRPIQDNNDPGWTRPEIIGFTVFNDTELNIRLSDRYSYMTLYYEYVTQDAGLTWIGKDLYEGIFGSNEFGFDVSYLAVNKEFGIAVEHGGSIIKIDFSNDLYFQYTTLLESYTKIPRKIVSIDERNYGILTDNGNAATYIYVTSDAGSNWLERKLTFYGYDGGSSNISGFAFPSKDNLIFCYNNWITKTEGNTTTMTPHGFIETTNDFCNTFIEYKDIKGSGYMDVRMSDKMNGIISSYGNEITFTSDCGKTWNISPLPDTSYYLRNTFTPTSGTFYAIASKNTGTSSTTYLLKTSDWGKTWDTKENSAVKTIWKMKFLNINDGYGIGYNYSQTGGVYYYKDFVAKTTDGGETWTHIYDIDTSSYSPVFNDFDCYDKNNIIIGRTKRQVLKTSNGGLQWETESILQLDPNDDIRSITYPSSDIIILTTSYGAVMRNVFNGSLSNEQDLSNIENNIAISPNPSTEFIEIENLSKRINFEVNIPKIRIYDVYGKVQTTALLSAASFYDGVEKLRVDVSNLPLGVYFIRIGNSVGKFVKM